MKLKTVPTHVRIPENVAKLAKETKLSYNQIADAFIQLYASKIFILYKKAGLIKKYQHPRAFKSIVFEGLEYKNLGNNISISIRINQCKKEALCKLTGGKDFGEALTIAIGAVAYCQQQGIPDVKSFNIKRPLIYLQGNKKKYVNIYNKIFRKTPDNITTYIDVCGGSGILTALASDSANFSKLIYNDLDTNKTNLIKAVSKSGTDFLYACGHGNIEALLENADGAEKNIYNAAQFCMSHQRNSKTETIFPKLCQYSQSLQSNQQTSGKGGKAKKRIVEVTNMDCETAIKKFMHHSNALLVIDPPYRNTMGYEINAPEDADTAFPIEKHERIDKLLLKCRATFLYCCRITASRDHQKRDNTQNDFCAKGDIDKAFSGKNLFFFDCEPETDGAIERIISNHQFCGFKPYL